MVKTTVHLFICLSSMIGQTQTKEESLKAQLEAAKERGAIAQAQLLRAVKDKAELANAISKAGMETKIEIAAGTAKQAESIAGVDRATAIQTAIALQAAVDAVKAANDAATAASTASMGSRNLIIVQMFSLVVVIVGFGYKGLEHHWDTAETIRKEGVAESQRVEAVRTAAEAAKNQSAKLEQIHSLVNSSLTAAMENELDARKSTLALLMGIIDTKKAASAAPNEELTVTADMTRKKITDLSSQLSDRKKVTDVAAAHLAVETGHPV